MHKTLTRQQQCVQSLPCSQCVQSLPCSQCVQSLPCSEADTMSSRETILCVGMCVLDIISEMSHYPEEDSDQRCLDQRWQRGGNASNNTTVLALLGAKAEYLGTIADFHSKRFLFEEFAKYGVNTEHVVVCKDCDSPCAYAILSQANGSRTAIVSNKNLPELTVEEFACLDLNLYRWIHFEGRNVTNVAKMMKLVREHNKSLPQGEFVTISVEIEEVKLELEALIPLADVVFVSKDYAIFKGYTSMAHTLEQMRDLAHPGAVIVCPWGEKGASACQGSGVIVHSPAFPPAKVVDTLGAGDTFNAATIFALTRGCALEDSIRFGCRVAGIKVGVMGWEPLQGLLAADTLLPGAQADTAH